jgi:hypothetical protein
VRTRGANSDVPDYCASDSGLCLNLYSEDNFYNFFVSERRTSDSVFLRRLARFIINGFYCSFPGETARTEHYSSAAPW